MIGIPPYSKIQILLFLSDIEYPSALAVTGSRSLMIQVCKLCNSQ